MGSSTAKIKRQSCAAETESTTIRKGNPYRFGQPLTKKFGKSGSQVPPPQQLRMVEKYVRGMSIRRIAEEEDRARQTVTKIVRAPEVQDYIANLRAEVIGLGDEMVRSVQFALRNEMDGRLGFEMLKAIGAMAAPQVQAADAPSWTEQHRRLAEEWTMKLGILAIEKHKVYGTELTPDLEELKQRLEELELNSTDMEQRVTPELKRSRKRHASLATEQVNWAQNPRYPRKPVCTSFSRFPRIKPVYHPRKPAKIGPSGAFGVNKPVFSPLSNPE